MRFALTLTVRVVALAIAYLICFAVVSGALLQFSTPQPPPDQATAGLALVIIAVLNTAVLSYVILRSNWAGWKLIVTIFLVYYGVVTVMSQIETAFFVTTLPPGMLPRLFLAGAIISALYSVLAVLILGKGKSESAGPGQSRLEMSFGQWVVRLSIIVAAYVVIYFTFGYFIAWQSAAVRSYYGGTVPANFLVQVSTTLREGRYSCRYKS